VSTTATVVVSILGFIAFFYVNLYAGSYRMRRAASAFLSALVHGRYIDAHALLTSRFQGTVSKESFERFLAERGITAIARFVRSLGDFSIGVDRGSVKPILVREDGMHFPIELAMRRERMSWRVDSIDVQVRLAPAPTLKAANDPDLRRIEVRVLPSYWSAFRAQLRMLFYSSSGWILSALFPLGGCYMIYRWSTLGGPPSIPDMLIAIAALFSAPLYVTLVTFLVWRNESAREPFTYAFDSEGFHLTTGGGAFSKPWAEIARVTESAGFLFVFVEPRVAHGIPLRTLRDTGCLNAIRQLVARQVSTSRRGSSAEDMTD
jgi:hypothetical protein